MARERQVNFGAGELAPSLHNRSDLPQYLRGAKWLRNFIPTKHGSLVNRPGTRFAGRSLSNNEPSRLFRFDFSDDQQYVIEVSGAGKTAVWKADGTPLTAPRYVALGVNNATGQSMSRTQASESEDPTGTWLDDAGGLSSTTTYVDVTTSGTRLLAVGGSNAAYSDNGGDTWTEYAHGLGIIPTSVAYYAATGRFYVGGANGTSAEIYSSIDGVTGWTLEYVRTAATSGVVRLFAGAGELGAIAGLTGPLIKYSLVDDAFVAGTLNINPVGTAFFAGRSAYHVRDTGQVYALDMVTLVPASLTTSALGVTADSVVGVGLGDAALLVVGRNTGSGALTTGVSYDGGMTWDVAAAAITGVYPQSAVMVIPGVVVMVGYTATAAVVYVYDVATATWTLEHTLTFSGAQFRAVTATDSEVLGAQAPFVFDTPWSDSALPKLRAVQSGDAMVFTCQGYAPKTLSRLSGIGTQVVWTFSDYFVDAPGTVVTNLALGGAGADDADHPNKEWTWKVSWEDANGVESLPSGTVDDVCPLYSDRPRDLTFDSIPGAVRYNIYRGRNGLFGWVGTLIATEGSSTETFHDDGQLPIVTRQPRTWDRPYEVNPPAVACWFQDRMTFANDLLGPARIRASATGDYQNFDIHTDFTADDEAIDLTLATRRYEEIRALIPSRYLVALTSEQEWIIGGQQGEPLTYRSIDARPQSARGCAWVEPVLAGNDIIFVQSQGNVLRGMAFNNSQDSYALVELSVYAQHMFATGTIVQMAFSQVPWSTLWLVTSDGRLLSMTYLREHEIVAWAEHPLKNVDGSDAFVESVCPVMEDFEEVIWLEVRRSFGGSTCRRIERMAKRQISTADEGCFLDCSYVYDSTPATTFDLSDAGYVENDVVTVWADGVKLTATVNAAQEITLATAASKVVIGIPITAQLTTLSSPQNLTLNKAVPRVWVETDAADWTWTDTSVGVSAGGEGGTLDKRSMASREDGVIEISIDTRVNSGGRVTIQVSDPIPVEIRGLVREVVDETE